MISTNKMSHTFFIGFFHSKIINYMSSRDSCFYAVWDKTSFEVGTVNILTFI